MNAFSARTICLLFLLYTIESTQIPEAKFSNHLTADSWFAFQSGQFWYQLDFTDFEFDLLPENCTEDGLSFKIHTEWTWGDSSNKAKGGDRMLEECNASYTGGSYDPWFACGPHSASLDCNTSSPDGCIPPSSVFEDSELYEGTYVCDPLNFDLIAYTCESGDISGKYGKLYPDEWSNITNDTEGQFLEDTGSSYWELTEDILMPNLPSQSASFSVVMSCSDGAPALCAPVLQGTSRQFPEYILDDTEVIEISFEEAGAEFDNFTISWNNQGVTFEIPESVGLMCSEWYLLLYDSYPYYDGADAAEAVMDCDVDAFGGIYDPTHTCVDDSGSLYCVNGRRCNQTDANYDCTGPDSGGDYRGCAVGDVSARIGIITYDNVTGGHQTITKEDPQSPPLFILDQRGIIMECLENTTLIENVCGGTTCDNCTSLAPVNNITFAPTAQTTNPTRVPSTDPTYEPTLEPTSDPTVEPTSDPTYDPTSDPTLLPTVNPTYTTESEDSSDEEKMEAGAAAGIAIGAVIFLFLIGVLIYVFVVKPSKYEKAAVTETASKDQVEMNKMKSTSADADEAEDLET